MVVAIRTIRSLHTLSILHALPQHLEMAQASYVGVSLMSTCSLVPSLLSNRTKDGIGLHFFNTRSVIILRRTRFGLYLVQCGCSYPLLAHANEQCFCPFDVPLLQTLLLFASKSGRQCRGSSAPLDWRLLLPSSNANTIRIYLRNW
jgi:hypothetical protein